MKRERLTPRERLLAAFLREPSDACHKRPLKDGTVWCAGCKAAEHRLRRLLRAHERDLFKRVVTDICQLNRAGTMPSDEYRSIRAAILGPQRKRGTR